MTAPQQLKRGGNPYYSIQRQPAVNNSGTNVIPSFGLVRVVNTFADGSLVVDQPDADGQDVYVNGPFPIPVSNSTTGIYGYGVVSKAFPIWAAYNNAATPAIGQTWGAANGSYLLTSGKTGFTIQAAPVTTGTARVLVDRTNATSYSVSTIGSAASLTSSWSNTGLSVTLPANTTWKLEAQLNATISSSASGAGDTLSFRYYDTTNLVQYGQESTICDAPCASISITDTGPLNTVAAIGSQAVTINLQGIVNTSSASTGSLSTNSNLIAIQLR